MAVVKMSKMHLIAVNGYKDEILNALARTGRVELSATKEIADTFIAPSGELKEKLLLAHDRALSAVDFFYERVERNKKEPFYPTDLVKGVEILSFDNFILAPTIEQKAQKVILSLETFKQSIATIKSEIIQNNTLISQLKPYDGIDIPFNEFKETKKTRVLLGTVKLELLDELIARLNKVDYTIVKVLSRGSLAVISIVNLKEKDGEVDQLLIEFGFNKSPFTFDQTASEKIALLTDNILALEQKERDIDKDISALSLEIRNVKIYADYYKFLLEKENANDEFRNTQKTFILEGYLPKDDEQEILGVINSVTKAVFVEFSSPTKDDNPPVLLKNRNPVKQSEFVTDMYSAPDYREIDPNKVVFFFFMLFMGVIMADVGYGLLMIVAGRLLASRIKIDNGARRLWNVISFSGIFAIIFGLLFNSFFGAALPYTAVLPNPVPKNGDTSGLMTILLLCLGLGVIHMATGYFLKALNGFRSKDIAGGILDGLTWVTFLGGLVFATFNFLVNYLMPEVYLTMNQGVKSFFDTMTLPGIIMVAGSVFIAMIGAGRNEKGFGKFTKGFGSVYGIINILSDILSYARLFGLMLSGMIIASTFNDMGMGLMQGGIIGIVFGAVVIVIGHLFNVAMGVLGAYIHNSRLQYIEFFGKFYTGEGEKFKPIGSNFDFIHIKN